MGLYNSIINLFKFTSGYEVEDRVQTNQMPHVPRPQVASKELGSQTRNNILGQSRYYVRNDGTVKELVSNLALYSVGAGISPQPMTSSVELNNIILCKFEAWWKKPEITGRFSGRQVQEFISKTYDIDGEIFIIKTFDPETYEPKIQIVESQQVKTFEQYSDFENGIKFDSYGRPVAYSIEQQDGTCQIVPASSVIHLFNAERASSTRGISTFAHLLPLTNQRIELLDLTIQKARQEAKFVNALEQARTDESLSAQDFLNATSSADEEAQEQERMLFESANRVSSVIGGTTVSLPSGMSLKQLSNNTPGGTYIPFAEQLLKLSTCGMLPYGFSDPSALTGTGVRMTIAKAGRIISARQDLICEAMTEIYHYFVGCLISSNSIEIGEEIDNIFKVEWLCSKNITIDHFRDERTDLNLLQSGVKPIADYYTERGLDYKKEVKARIEAMKEIREMCAEENISPSVIFPALFPEKR